MIYRYFLFVLLLIGVAVADGFEIIEFDNKQLENRYQVLLQELRCLVCQNQTLADSGAGLAKDMRVVVYDMINKGHTNDEIIQFMVDRYGNFVRYEPPFTLKTAVLWLMPFIVVLLMILFIPKFVRQQQAVSLNDAQREQAKKLLK